MCKQIQPDFNQEEICSIAKDSQDLAKLIQDMQEFLPQQDAAAGTCGIENNDTPQYPTAFFLFFFFFAEHRRNNEKNLNNRNVD